MPHHTEFIAITGSADKSDSALAQAVLDDLQYELQLGHKPPVDSALYILKSAVLDAVVEEERTPRGLAEHIRQMAPRDTGQLARSVGYKVLMSGYYTRPAGVFLAVGPYRTSAYIHNPHIVFDPVRYWDTVQTGRSAGTRLSLIEMIQLKGWAKRHGIRHFKKLLTSIETKGTQPNPFVERGTKHWLSSGGLSRILHKAIQLVKSPDYRVAKYGKRYGWTAEEIREASAVARIRQKLRRRG